MNVYVDNIRAKLGRAAAVMVAVQRGVVHLMENLQDPVRSFAGQKAPFIDSDWWRYIESYRGR